MRSVEMREPVHPRTAVLSQRLVAALRGLWTVPPAAERRRSNPVRVVDSLAEQLDAWEGEGGTSAQ